MVGSLAGPAAWRRGDALGARVSGRPAVPWLVPGRRAARRAAPHALMPAARMGQRAGAVARRPAHDHPPGTPRVARRALPRVRPPRRARLVAHKSSRTHIRASRRYEGGPEPHAVLARGDDPPEPPAVLARG